MALPELPLRVLLLIATVEPAPASKPDAELEIPLPELPLIVQLLTVSGTSLATPMLEVPPPGLPRTVQLVIVSVTSLAGPLREPVKMPAPALLMTLLLLRASPPRLKMPPP